MMGIPDDWGEDYDMEEELMNAVEHEFLEGVEELLPRVDLPARIAALAHAASTEALDSMDFLLKAGVPPTDPAGEVSPLHRAAKAGCAEAVGILLDAGVPPDVLDKAKRTPLSYAGSATVFRVLVLSGAAAAGGAGKNPLHCAAWEGRIGLVLELIHHLGVDVNAREPQYGMTPLHKAAMALRRAGCAECVAELTLAGADARAVDNLGRTPLYFLNAMDAHPWLRGRCYKLLYIDSVLMLSGAREWRYVPRPCRFLEATLLTVWKRTAEELSGLFKCLVPDVQARIQATLRALHRGARPFGGMPDELRMRLIYTGLHKWHGFEFV